MPSSDNNAQCAVRTRYFLHTGDCEWLSLGLLAPYPYPHHLFSGTCFLPIRIAFRGLFCVSGIPNPRPPLSGLPDILQLKSRQLSVCQFVSRSLDLPIAAR
jgi:hypothetical protein